VISDAERRRLAEIETVLRREDPAFVQRFEKRRRTARRPRILARLAIALVLAVTMVVAVVVAGTVAAVDALWVMGVVGVAIGLWRYCARPPRRRR
jgi:hypothetical protein